jgi:putative ABC transport system substrate-binding protein
VGKGRENVGLGEERSMREKIIVPLLASLVLASAHLTYAQQAKVYRVGVILQGGPDYVIVEGLKSGLRNLGFEAGRHYLLEIRDLKGDRKAAEEAGRSLEREKVDLIYAVNTSVNIVVKGATREVPIVFAVGADPVVAGLIESYAKPGGRLTGVHFLSVDLTAKRLEILKEILPKLRKVVTFYDSGNEVALVAAKAGREAARQLKIEVVERPVASVEELRLGLMSLKAEDADAYYYTSDAMVTSQAQFINDTARAKKLPTMGYEQSLVAQGALVSYGVSYYEIGRLSAKYVQRVLTGTSPQNLPVESVSRLVMAVNLNTARELGLTIPQVVLLRADEVIQ